MRRFGILVLLVFASIAIPVQGGQYLTEAQKELMLEKSRALGAVSKKEHAQTVGNQNNQSTSTKQQSSPTKSRRTTSRYLGVVNKHPTERTATIAKTSQTESQSIQSLFKTADWGTPNYSDRSVQESRKVATTTNSNRYIQQDQRLAITAKKRGHDKRSQPVARTNKKKFNWSGLFNGLSQIAGAINQGLNRTNTRSTPYIPQPTNFTQQGNNQTIRTMSVGNQVLNVGGTHRVRAYNVGNHTFGTVGDQRIHTYGVGNQTFGTFGNKDVRMYNYGNFSHGTVGGQKVRCHTAGNLQFCK